MVVLWNAHEIVNAMGLGNCVAAVLAARGLWPGIVIALMAVIIFEPRFRD